MRYLKEKVYQKIARKRSYPKTSGTTTSICRRNPQNILCILDEHGGSGYHLG
jgi:hypothetical protein